MKLSDYPHLILIRPTGELATKSRHTRRRFQRILVDNLEDALAASGVSYQVSDDWGRCWVGVSSLECLDVIARVFGIASLSAVEATAEARLDAIIEVGERTYGERVRGRKFAVRARRVGHHPFTSLDINYKLGSALDRYGRVDLRHPDVAVCVEVRQDEAYFFSQRLSAGGGLPAGVEGLAVSLVSGGYDSAVAAWMMLKRGVALDYVFCNLAGGAYERAVLCVAKLLADEWSFGLRPRIHVVDFEAILQQLKDRVQENYWQVVLKRLMYRTADQIAEQVGAQAIITGEAVGQVSSQTLANLRAIDAVARTPVLRPLAGFDKQEIIERSRLIGTYALSEKVREHCALTERRPVTDSTPESVALHEEGLDLAELDEAIVGRRIIDLRCLEASDLVLPYLYVASIPSQAVVVDTRPRRQYDAWHFPGAVHHDFWRLFADPGDLDRQRSYVLYCEIGLLTAQLAEKLQRAGFEAYSFKGGARLLREYAEGLQPA